MNNCVQCSLDASHPIVLQCSHILCLRCGDKLKVVEKDASLRERQSI